MNTEKKVFILIGLATLLILVGSVYWISKQDERLSKPLLGQEVTITGSNHLPQGTAIQYNSSPPAAGPHYLDPAHAGIYTTAPADGNLVHSLEHGAIILWYQSNLAKEDIDKLKYVFDQMPVGKKIMTPRESLDVQFALSSWGRVLKLQTIDMKQIKDFFETNHDRSPENAPIY